jgi:hypothetical protein
MQIANIPAKYYVPFAMNDMAKVAIPITTTDATRASLSLGFPPLTGMPPEAGGVPPQLEDFNGAINQIAGIAWWLMAGGPFPYDTMFATSTYVTGYPQGATIEAADYLGSWINTMDNNQSNPDTVGTGWVPGYAYGATPLTGLTGGTVTLTPLQAAKRQISLAGALTSNLFVVLPTWLTSWQVTNMTTGMFTVTVKTLAGAGVLIPQNSSPTKVTGDGTNITQPIQNVRAINAVAQVTTPIVQAPGVATQLLLESGLAVVAANIGNTGYVEMYGAPGTVPEAFTNLGQFGVSLSTSGYQELPSGLLFQWGYVPSGTSFNSSIVFPIAFPHAALVVTGNINSTTTNYIYSLVFYDITATTFDYIKNSIVTNATAGGGASEAFYWFALGY